MLRCDYIVPGQLPENQSGRFVLGEVTYGLEGSNPLVLEGVPVLPTHMAADETEVRTERWTVDQPVRTGTENGLVYGYTDDYLFCAGYIPGQDTYTDATRAAYTAVFELVERLGYPSIFRMWNLIGRINEPNAEGLEIYQDFCRGRAEAFESYAAEGRDMPSATGIGSRGEGVAFYFLASRTGARVNIENTRQIPAYNYPEQYGPKSPSFARATHLTPRDAEAGAAHLYVSGTAAILGHQTVHSDSIDKQCRVALENIEHLIGDRNLQEHGIARGHELSDLTQVKVYVRHLDDMPQVREACQDAFPDPVDIAYFNVDICRADLLVEIEGIIA
ncbi:FkbO/Hyg5 family chorismatase [Streptomyces sp. LX-29]|uniref:FkbO/Hyg5 family chorismatase n=1 Tax=Streptomyces sp. LX-29 TaxID=2900152 RepID=UPI00240DF8B0|nr:FkbO/Hyg5 family chorismatase [Streptomyces sp. LX-29]WFB10961.1 FkbO/Hyg5 family chorismatase [Streptomyces sp. LX-29]